jgi:hypothetical protein
MPNAGQTWTRCDIASGLHKTGRHLISKPPKGIHHALYRGRRSGHSLAARSGHDLVTTYTIAGFIHILLVIAIVVTAIRLISGRSQ